MTSVFYSRPLGRTIRLSAVTRSHRLEPVVVHNLERPESRSMSVWGGRSGTELEVIAFKQASFPQCPQILHCCYDVDQHGALWLCSLVALIPHRYPPYRLPAIRVDSSHTEMTVPTVTYCPEWKVEKD